MKTETEETTKEISKERNMQAEPKPLFSLTIGEYMSLTRKLIEDALAGKALAGTEQIPDPDGSKEFTIKGLMNFLGCSKASVHNYKNLGMPFYRVGRKVLFKKDEVLNFMKGIKNRKRKMKQ
jgi:excisionase family DNA binding protein